MSGESVCESVFDVELTLALEAVTCVLMSDGRLCIPTGDGEGDAAGVLLGMK